MGHRNRNNNTSILPTLLPLLVQQPTIENAGTHLQKMREPNIIGGFLMRIGMLFCAYVVGSGIGCILFLEYQLHARVLLGSGLIFLCSSGHDALAL